jgi:hypothetical protein
MIYTSEIKWKSQIITSVGEDVENLEPSYSARKDCKMAEMASLEKESSNSSKCYM